MLNVLKLTYPNPTKRNPTLRGTYRYLGLVMTADYRDDKDIRKQFRRQNAVGNMLVQKFSFAPTEAKIKFF